MKKLAFSVAVVVLLAAVLVSAGSSSDDPGEEAAPPTEQVEADFRLFYLDNTEAANDTWKVTISNSVDQGVLLLRNRQDVEDSFSFHALAPEGWKIGFEKESVTVGNDSVAWNVITYTLPDSASTGSYNVNISAISKNNGTVRNITLVCEVAALDGNMAQKGDQLLVTYVLWDENRTGQLDSGTLPATCGEPEAGPAGQVGYIDGFYLGLYGMEKGGVLGASPGETKEILVPPELAYGVNSGSELSDMWLIFQQTLGYA